MRDVSLLLRRDAASAASASVEAALVAGLASVARGDPDEARRQVSAVSADLEPDVVVSELSVRPTPAAPLVTLSNFLAYPDLALQLCVIDDLLARGAQAASIEALKALDQMLLSVDCDRTPAVVFPIVAAGDDLRPGFPAELARMLLAEHVTEQSRSGAWLSLESTHAMIDALVSVLDPQQLELMLVDIKCELRRWKSVPHLAAPIAENSEEALHQLRVGVACMETRYQSMRACGVSDVEDFNRSNPARPIPRVVVVVDELAELMMTSPVQAETLVGRLAREGHPAGISVVPSLRGQSDFVLLPSHRPATLRGLTALSCWTYLSAGHPDDVLALLGARETTPRTPKSSRQAPAISALLRSAARLASSSMFFSKATYKAAALAMKGLTDAALLVYDDVIRQAGDDTATRDCARYAKADLLVRSRDIGAARRELARLYADEPSWNDRLGLLDAVKVDSRRAGREPIPEHVRHAVWRRDQGRCVRCGSQERLEFDHVIPLARGGANSERNLQLLCETCNRRKGASV